MVSIVPALQPAWVAVAVALVLAAAADGAAALRMRPPTAQRELPASLPLGVAHEVRLRLRNEARQSVRCEIHDHVPSGFEAAGLPCSLVVPGQGWVEARYTARPVRRGAAKFGRVEARLRSRTGLWQVRRMLGAAATTRIYPNFAALTRFAVLATDNRLSQIGVLQRRRRGEGLDFRQLRDYREGDAVRQIDWKASARVRKLISREYQDERDQQVLLVLDCGRRMAAQDDALSHFDHVLNAALLLAYASLRQGDAVGFLTVAGEPRWFAPRKSVSTVNRILNRVYDLHPTLQTTDYYGAALEVMKRQRKRSLVVVLSNLRDEDDDSLGPALGLMQTRHLVLFASLREAILSRALRSRVDGFDRALTHAAAADYLQRRELALHRLESRGAVCIDVEPPELPIALVNRYIDLKRSGRL